MRTYKNMMVMVVNYRCWATILHTFGVQVGAWIFYSGRRTSQSYVGCTAKIAGIIPRSFIQNQLHSKLRESVMHDHPLVGEAESDGLLLATMALPDNSHSDPLHGLPRIQHIHENALRKACGALNIELHQ